MLEVFVKSNSHIPIVSMYKHQINKCTKCSDTHRKVELLNVRNTK